MNPTPGEVEAGHAFYTRRSLAIYDLAILWYFSRLAWKCPAHRVLRRCDEHVSGNHLDIGVGTGYFLDHCTFPTATPRLALMDPSEACLGAASRRTERYTPERHRASVLEPFELGGPGLDSIGLTYLLHCLPGDIRSKSVAFVHIHAVANPGAAVFGATLLHDGVDKNWLAREVMTRNNAHGIFSNVDDDLDGLRRVLEQHLDEPTIEMDPSVPMRPRQSEPLSEERRQVAAVVQVIRAAAALQVWHPMRRAGGRAVIAVHGRFWFWLLGDRCRLGLRRWLGEPGAGSVGERDE